MVADLCEAASFRLRSACRKAGGRRCGMIGSTGVPTGDPQRDHYRDPPSRLSPHPAGRPVTGRTGDPLVTQTRLGPSRTTHRPRLHASYPRFPVWPIPFRIYSNPYCLLFTFDILWPVAVPVPAHRAGAGSDRPECRNCRDSKLRVDGFMPRGRTRGKSHGIDERMVPSGRRQSYLCGVGFAPANGNPRGIRRIRRRTIVSHSILLTGKDHLP